jgi:hypothetical protein
MGIVLPVSLSKAGCAILSAGFAGAVEDAVGACAIVVLKDRAGLQNQPARLAEQGIKREVCGNWCAIGGARAIPIRGS